MQVSILCLSLPYRIRDRSVLLQPSEEAQKLFPLGGSFLTLDDAFEDTSGIVPLGDVQVQKVMTPYVQSASGVLENRLFFQHPSRYRTMLSYEVNAKPTEPVGIIENSPLKCNCANLAWYDKRNGEWAGMQEWEE